MKKLKKERGPVMVADRKIAWPGAALGRQRRPGNFEHVRKIMGRVDGVADPPLQAGHRGLRCPGGQVMYLTVESPRGELGYHLVSDGGTRPLRCTSASPAS